MRSAGKFLSALFSLTLVFSLTSQAGFAQQPDPVAQGVIKVRRAQVSSDYIVKFNYSYLPDTAKRFFHWRKQQHREVTYSPPDPVAVDPNRNDSNQTLVDSSFVITFYTKQGNPAGDFNWGEWLSQYEHTFDWSDTSGIDSAAFVFAVNPRGDMECRAVPPAREDSSSLALQQNLFPLMKRLWAWYPAYTVTGDARRRKPVACIVTVKVYAVREGEKIVD